MNIEFGFRHVAMLFIGVTLAYAMVSCSASKEIELQPPIGPDPIQDIRQVVQMTTQEFYSLEPFGGTIGSYGIINESKNNGENNLTLWIEIESRDHLIRLNDFHAHKNAIREINKLRSQDVCHFPESIRRLRRSIVYD